MHTQFSIHGASIISASPGFTSGSPLTLEFRTADWRDGNSRIVIFTHNQELTEALAKAINDCVAAEKARVEAAFASIPTIEVAEVTEVA